MNAVVAVKIVEHSVQPGQTHDLSREPLLRWAGSAAAAPCSGVRGLVRESCWPAGVQLWAGRQVAQFRVILFSPRRHSCSMSVSHPNVVITHKMAIVKVSSGADAAAAAAQQQQQQRPADGRASGSGGSRKGSGQLVPALDGSGGMVEVVSPSDVLQPGLYETWLVSGVGEG